MLIVISQSHPGAGSPSPASPLQSPPPRINWLPPPAALPSPDIPAGCSGSTGAGSGSTGAGVGSTGAGAGSAGAGSTGAAGCAGAGVLAGCGVFAGCAVLVGAGVAAVGSAVGCGSALGAGVSVALGVAVGLTVASGAAVGSAVGSAVCTDSTGISLPRSWQPTSPATAIATTAATPTTMYIYFFFIVLSSFLRGFLFFFTIPHNRMARNPLTGTAIGNFLLLGYPSQQNPGKPQRTYPAVVDFIAEIAYNNNRKGYCDKRLARFK